MWRRWREEPVVVVASPGAATWRAWREKQERSLIRWTNLREATRIPPLGLSGRNRFGVKPVGIAKLNAREVPFLLDRKSFGGWRPLLARYPEVLPVSGPARCERRGKGQRAVTKRGRKEERRAHERERRFPRQGFHQLPCQLLVVSHSTLVVPSLCSHPVLPPLAWLALRTPTPEPESRPEARSFPESKRFRAELETGHDPTMTTTTGRTRGGITSLLWFLKTTTDPGPEKLLAIQRPRALYWRLLPLLVCSRWPHVSPPV